MISYNTFTTFEESNTAQAYDFNRYCAKKFSDATGIDLDIILNLGLHLDTTLRHQYYDENGITFTDTQKDCIHGLANNLYSSNRWANISLYNDMYIYVACPESDAVHSTIELSLEETKSLQSLNDDGVYIPATDWE